MEVNYLKLNDRVYALSEIQAQGIDINEDLKEFYQQRHSQLAKEFGTVLTDGMREEWDKQIEHLRKFEDKGIVSIPADLHGKPVIVYKDMLMPLRAFVYAPTEVTTTMAWLERCELSYSNPMWDGIRDTDSTVILTIKPPFSILTYACFDAKANRMYTPFFRTYHTLSGMSICTGKHKASDFWKLSDEEFRVQMCKINTFSPATDNIQVLGNTYRLKRIISNDSIESVVKREDTTWTA